MDPPSCDVVEVCSFQKFLLGSSHIPPYCRHPRAPQYWDEGGVGDGEKKRLEWFALARYFAVVGAVIREVGMAGGE